VTVTTVKHLHLLYGIVGQYLFNLFFTSACILAATKECMRFKRSIIALISCTGIIPTTHVKIIVCIYLIYQCLYVLLIFRSLVMLMSFSPKQTDQKSENAISEYKFKTEPSPEVMLGSIIVQSIIAIAGVVVCVLLLYGLKTRRPGYYWPYLVWAIIEIIYAVIIIAISTIFIFAEFVSPTQKENHILRSVIYLIFFIGLILGLIFYIYFSFVIVNRSRKLLDAEIHNPIPSPGPYQPNIYTSSYNR